MQAGGGWQARHTQLALLFFARLIQSVMRMAMGPLVGYVCEDLRCEASSRGSLLSAFSLGYLLTQIPGGYVCDVLGSKAVVLVAVSAAGCLTIVGGSAATVDALWWLQVAMGAAQAAAA